MDPFGVYITILLIGVVMAFIPILAGYLWSLSHFKRKKKLRENIVNNDLIRYKIVESIVSDLEKKETQPRLNKLNINNHIKHSGYKKNVKIYGDYK